MAEIKKAVAAVKPVASIKTPVAEANKEEAPNYWAQLDEKYEQLRHQYNEEQQQLLSLEEARKNKLDLF